MTPAELALDLGVTDKAVRAWLRAHHPRSTVEHGQRWVLDAETVDAARRHFSGGARELRARNDQLRHLAEGASEVG